MALYTAETMSRRDLRRCYSLYGISVLLAVGTSFLVVNGSFLLYLSLFPVFPEAVKAVLDRYLAACLCNSFLGYLPAMAVYALVLRRLPRAERIPRDPLDLGELVQAAVFVFGVGYLSSSMTGVVIQVIEQVTQHTTSNVLEGINEYPMGLNLLFTVFVGPIMEEILYRRILLNRLRGLGDLSAVLLSALAFALAHVNLYQFVYAFSVGMVFAAIVLLTGSIRDTCLLHILFNGFSVLVNLKLSEAVLFGLGLFVLFSMAVSVPMFFLTRKRYHMEPGSLPFRGDEKRRACFKSAWFWGMLAVCFAFSLLRIF